jgi:hypothetical protein
MPTFGSLSELSKFLIAAIDCHNSLSFDDWIVILKCRLGNLPLFGTPGLANQMPQMKRGCEDFLLRHQPL